MRPHIFDALASLALVSGATTLATLACSSEDPARAPGGTTTQTTTATGTAQGTPSTAAGPTTASSVTSTTATSGGMTSGSGTTGVGGGTAAASATSVGGATSTTTAVTTGSVATSAGGSGTTGTATATTDGGSTLTDEQCQGISSDDPCTTPGTCAPRPCGLADTGTRTCTCATTWDCTSCAWTEPYAEVAVPPETPLTACAAEVADEVACATKGERCMQADEVCACWLEEDAGTIWDCDSPPSFWP